jgi:hypothetical protein
MLTFQIIQAYSFRGVSYLFKEYNGIIFFKIILCTLALALSLNNYDFTLATVFCCLKGHLLEYELQKRPLKTKQF